MDDTSVTIRKVEFWPVDVPVTDPFVGATGARTIAENVFLRITLDNGAQGYGEAAPFPEVGGETRESCLIALRQLCKVVLGRSAADYKEVGRLLSEQALTHPAARCGLETAVIDAYCRASNIPSMPTAARRTSRCGNFGVARMCERERRISPLPSLTSTRPSPWRADGMRRGFASSK